MTLAVVVLSIITVFQGYRLGKHSNIIKHNANVLNRLTNVADQEIESLKYRISKIEEKLSPDEYSNYEI